MQLHAVNVQWDRYTLDFNCMFIKVSLAAGVHMFTIEAVNGNRKDMAHIKWLCFPVHIQYFTSSLPDRTQYKADELLFSPEKLHQRNIYDVCCLDFMIYILQNLII